MCLKVCVQKEMKFFIFCFLFGWKLFRKNDVCYFLKKWWKYKIILYCYQAKITFYSWKKGCRRGHYCMVIGFITTYAIWLSPLMLWVWTLLRCYVLDTILCDKVCQWLVNGCLRVLQFPPSIKLTATTYLKYCWK